jgi:hypothetical protein
MGVALRPFQQLGATLLPMLPLQMRSRGETITTTRLNSIQSVVPVAVTPTLTILPTMTTVKTMMTHCLPGAHPHTVLPPQAAAEFQLVFPQAFPGSCLAPPVASTQ